MLDVQKLQLFSQQYFATAVQFNEIDFSELFSDLEKIYNLVLCQTEASYCWNKKTPIFARPDVYFSKNGFKILELNIDTSLSQGKSAFLQNCYGVVDKESKIVPFVQVFASLINKIGQPVAFLGVKERSHVVDKIESWFIEQINLLTQHSARFYPASDWLINKTISEPIFIRLFSGYQIYRNSDMQEVYEQLQMRSKDLYPLRNFPILESKFLLSQLWEAKENGYLSKGEAYIVEKYFPLTFRLSEKTLEEKKYLKKDLLENRKGFVIKKASSHAGKDVYIGSEMTRREWEKKVYAAVKKEDSILQEYVDNIVKKKFPITDGRGIFEKELNYIIGPYFIDGKVPGVLIRAWEGSFSKSFQNRIISISNNYKL